MSSLYSGVIEVPSYKLFEMQKDFFSRVEQRIKQGGLEQQMHSEDEFLLYSILPKKDIGHSIMYVSSPLSTSNWEVEPIDFKLLGSRIITSSDKTKRIPVDVEAVDIEGKILPTYDDSNDHYFGDLSLIYKSYNKKKPSIKLSYNNFEYLPEESNKDVEIIFNAKDTPERVKSYEPLFDTYFKNCLSHFLPVSGLRTFEQKDFNRFRKSLIAEISSKIDFDKKVQENDLPVELSLKDSMILINDILTRKYIDIVKRG